jgi:hypothetical protein
MACIKGHAGNSSGSPMMGAPPICQSPAGNGGESNGAGGMRRFDGKISGAGAV